MSKERILYFFFGAAAVIFASSDVIAQFDKDPDTKTVTYYLKSHWGKILTALGILWFTLHVYWEGFPL